MDWKGLVEWWKADTWLIIMGLLFILILMIAVSNLAGMEQRINNKWIQQIQANPCMRMCQQTNPIVPNVNITSQGPT